MVNTINPADAKPGEVYEGTVHGVKRTVLVRQDYDDPDPWESLSEVLDHEDVSDLVRLVPARKITRADLPDVCAAYSKIPEQDCGDLIPSDLAPVLDAVVSHLNANGGVLVSREDAALADRLERQATSIARLQGELETAEGDRSRWRRAHGIVEQERITARQQLAEAVARAEAAERELAGLRGSLAGAEQERDQARDQWKKWEHEAREQANRAEDAERERDGAIRERRQMEDDHAKMCREWRGMDARVVEAERERDEARESADKWHGEWQKIAPAPAVVRAEAAEARTAPTVSRADVEKAIHGVYAAHGNWAVADEMTDAVCDLFGVETGQATDPVEQKAAELFRVVHPDDEWEWPNASPEVLERYRRLACHVLGQEANDE